jgi:RHS repeat-associated protein
MQANTLQPNILTTNSYYPYGMLIKSLSQNSETYRWGFQGHEQDNEIKGTGNHLSFGNYGYDTRLGRRWNLDPVDQIGISNYAVFGNNPIMLIDKNSKFPIAVHIEIMKTVMGKYNLPLKIQSNDDVYGMVDNGLITGVGDADRFGFAFDYHFDGKEDREKVYEGWEKLNNQLAQKEYNPHRTGLGARMHNVQDFYAHSNYVELYIEYYKDQGGDISKLTPEDIPSYAEAMKTDFKDDKYTNRLKTGTFSIFTWLTGIEKKDPNSHYNMNKDKNKGQGAVIPEGANYTLHEFSVGAATNATEEELGKKLEPAP